VRVGKSEFTRSRRRRAPPGTSTLLTAPVWGNKDSAQVGPSMVAALVNSTPNVHSGAAATGPMRFRGVYPTSAPALQPSRFRHSGRSRRPGAGQRSTRFFALIELVVHRRKLLSHAGFDTPRRHFLPSPPGFRFSPRASNGDALWPSRPRRSCSPCLSPISRKTPAR
jgi:hypothetical protein